MSIVGAAVLGIALVGSGGCGSSYGSGDASTTYESSDLSRAHHRYFQPGQRPGSTGPSAEGFDAGAAAATSGTGGAGSSAGGSASGAGGAGSAGAASTPAATTDVQAVIAAAQKPDGTAIPQGPGPNGQCPEVLVLLGFWSCPQIGQTCSYTSGATHHCLCDRLNGEGGLPAWVCDQ
ncbi:MAG TPA: hypothetical protein VIK30_12690 [Polyangia bacterium]